MTASWESRRRQGRDAAFQVFYRMGLDTMDLATEEGPTPAFLRELAVAVTKVIAEPACAVLDGLDMELDDAARVRIIVSAASRTVHASLWGIADAIGNELARPQPVPFVPPPARSWIRCRWLSRGATRHGGRAWDGMWHVYSGDFSAGDVRSQDVTGRALCGARLRMRSVSLFDDAGGQDFVMAEGMPGVDACRRCARSLG